MSTAKHVESPFIIYPREARRVVVCLDHLPLSDGQVLLWTLVTTDPSVRILEMRAAQTKVPTTEVPADVDPYDSEWIGYAVACAPSECLVLLIHNARARPGPSGLGSADADASDGERRARGNNHCRRTD